MCCGHATCESRCTFISWISCHPVRSIMCTDDSQGAASCRLCDCALLCAEVFTGCGKSSSGQWIVGSSEDGEKTTAPNWPQSILSYLCPQPTAPLPCYMFVALEGPSPWTSSYKRRPSWHSKPLTSRDFKRHQKTQINKQQQTARNRKKQQQTPANRNEQLLKRQNSRKDSSRSIAKEQSQIVPNNLNSSNTKHKSAI